MVNTRLRFPLIDIILERNVVLTVPGVNGFKVFLIVVFGYIG